MKKKICFISMGNIYLCPYINKYIENINCDFDIIYWDRDSLNENIGAEKTYNYNYSLSLTDSKYKKIKGYIGFKKYASKILKINNYEGVIVLQTIAGVLLSRILRKKYFNRFILDIRDYTLENNKFFYNIEKKIIEASNSTIISSEGFKEFLPDSDYTLIHNNRTLDGNLVAKIRKREKDKEKIVIAFIGYVNYQEQHKKLLNIFKNDNRFELRFIGKEAEKLISFCNENNIKNVKIIGQFPPERILEYYEDIDIIHNLYGNNTPILDYALSNKLYFAAELAMPILVCENTFMEEISVKNGFGYSFNLNNKDNLNELYSYYKSIDWNKFEKNCDCFIKKVDVENKLFKKNVIKFIEGEEND